MGFLIFFGLLLVLIWVHELGHFSAAKFFGVRVHEFAIGFPPRLFTIRKGETDYSFNLLLVGGYVQIHGEHPGEGEADPRALSSKPRLVQAAVMLAGIVFNLVFAWLALSAGYMAGMPTSVDHQGFGAVGAPKVVVVSVLPDSPAARAGVLQGDVVVKVETGTDSLSLETLSTNQQSEVVRGFIGAHAEESIVLTVERAGEEKIFLAKAEEGLVEGRKALGVQMQDVGILKLPPHLALAQGALALTELTVATAYGLAGFFGSLAFGQADFSSVAGPIGIVSLGSTVVTEGFATAVLLTAMISVSLALFNLVPIPGLDGGRLLIIGIESIIRRPVSAQVTTLLTLAGFACIVSLLLLVSYHDVARLLG